jgi:hypothetical protein
MDILERYRLEDMHMGKVGLTHLFGCHKLLSLVGSLLLMCVMLSGGYLVRFKFTRVSATLSDMSDTCPLLSFSSNVIFIMLIILLKMIFDYFVDKA